MLKRVRQVFDTHNVDSSYWPRYRKKVTTAAIKVNGPFTVETSEGPLACEDGYLAVDARGYPYPIATEEFEMIYEPVDDSDIR